LGHVASVTAPLSPRQPSPGCGSSIGYRLSTATTRLTHSRGETMRQRRLRTVAIAGLAVLALTACGDDEGASESPDFTTADLEDLNFAPDEIPRMEYQPDSSGPGAFSEDQREEAKEEGEKSGLKLLDRLGELGLEAEYVSQFFATSRGAELSFVESITFLFEDEGGAEEAVDVLREASAKNLKPADEIDAPELGEQTFGLQGKFDDLLTYSFGWRVGDVIQILGVAPGDQHAGPETTIELAEQLETKTRE
jgi:hypothetical protein